MSERPAPQYVTSPDPEKAAIFMNGDELFKQQKSAVGRRAIDDITHPAPDQLDDQGYGRRRDQESPITEKEVGGIAVAEIDEKMLALQKEGLDKERNQALYDQLQSMKDVLVDVVARSAHTDVHQNLVKRAEELATEGDPQSDIARRAAGYFLSTQHSVSSTHYSQAIRDHNDRVANNSQLDT